MSLTSSPKLPGYRRPLNIHLTDIDPSLSHQNTQIMHSIFCVLILILQCPALEEGPALLESIPRRLVLVQQDEMIDSQRLDPDDHETLPRNALIHDAGDILEVIPDRSEVFLASAAESAEAVVRGADHGVAGEAFVEGQC